jgi:predicted permease
MNIALSLGFFIALGVVWRIVRPHGVSADALQKAVTGVVLWVLLPFVVFFTISDMPLNESALRLKQAGDAFVRRQWGH